MRKSYMLLVLVALAVLVSACAGPTAPSCTTVASCQAQENPTPGSVPPSTVATVSNVRVWLGTTDTQGPTPTQNADGSYNVPVGQWFTVIYTVNNPQAPGRTIAFGLNPLDPGAKPWSDNFAEPTRPAQVYPGDRTICDKAGRVIPATLSGSETGGNLLSPTNLAAAATIKCQ